MLILKPTTKANNTIDKFYYEQLVLIDMNTFSKFNIVKKSY
jgi:hypothetical protein